MSNGDKLVFDLSQETEATPNIFIQKAWLSILDNMNGQYSSGQIVIDTSQLSNSNKYMNYREGYLAVPMLLSLASVGNGAGFAPATAATSCDYAIGLKSWFGNVLAHSISVDFNGTTVIQQTPFCNMWNCFKLLTTLSWNDVITDGASYGFYPDDPLSWSWASAANLSGLGVCNNTNFGGAGGGALQTVVNGAFNNYGSASGNKGFLKRQQYINYDVAGVPQTGTYADFLTAATCNNVWKSYVSTRVDSAAGNTGMFQISIMGFVHLKHLHSFFNSLPLLKGVFMKLTITTNQPTMTFTVAGGNYTAVSVSSSSGGVNPMMLASRVASNGGVALGNLNYRANLSIGATCIDSAIRSSNGYQGGQLASSVYLYVPAYSFNPVFEQAYLSTPIKTVSYTDIYQYSIPNVGAGANINSLLTNGLANVMSCLIIPIFSTGAVNNIINIPSYQSPFDTVGCGTTSPLAHLTNFNIVVSGQNSIYTSQRYLYEEWLNQLSGQGSVNANLTDGLTSGLIDQLGFEMNYCYYYVDISRMLPVEESVPKSIQVVGQNASARILDLFCFVEYGSSISIDALTGARV